MTSEQFGAAVFIGAFAIGVRSTWRIWSWRDDSAARLGRPIITLLVVIAILVTALCGYIGFLTLRTALGFEPLPGLRPLTLLVVAAVLLIPLYIERTGARIRRGPE